MEHDNGPAIVGLAAQMPTDPAHPKRVRVHHHEAHPVAPHHEIASLHPEGRFAELVESAVDDDVVIAENRVPLDPGVEQTAIGFPEPSIETPFLARVIDVVAGGEDILEGMICAPLAHSLRHRLLLVAARTEVPITAKLK